MNAGDKAECKEIARQIIKEVLLEHINSCPYGRVIYGAKWFLVGVFVFTTGAGMGLGAILAKLFG